MVTTIESQWMQNRTYSAREDRALIAGLFDEGVTDLGSHAVSEASPAGMSVEVSGGEAVVTGDDQANQNNYFVQSISIDDVTIAAADPTNPRIDLVVLQVRDPNAGGSAGDDAIVTTVSGTPAGSPVAPALPASALLLAEVSVGAGATSILDADITDARVIAGHRDSPGSLKAFAGSSTRLPSGWLLCDGSAVSRATYDKLFSQVGTAYGNGDGSTTFNLPDMRARFPLAAGTGYTVEGATGGADERTITEAMLPSHSHSIAHDHSLNNHTHSFSDTSTSAGSHSHSVDHDHASATSGSGGTHTHSIAHNHGAKTSSSGGGHSHSTNASFGRFVTTAFDGLTSVLDTWGIGGVNLANMIAAYPGTSAIAYHGDQGSRFTSQASTDVVNSHTHSVDLDNYTGNSGGQSASHTHSVNLPNFSGTSGSQSAHTHDVSGTTGASSGSTAASSAANTGSIGSGDALPTMPPYQVVGGWLIRT
jgi:microcystin-dependent protein